MLNICEHFLQSRNSQAQQQKCNQEVEDSQAQQQKCNQEVEVLLDCGHRTIFKCWQKEELQKSYICKQVCIKKRICGHSFNKCQNYCFQQQCTPCIQKITIKLDCDHEQQIYCYQKDEYKNNLCEQCQNKKKQSKNQQNKKNNFNQNIIVTLQCGHKVQTTYDQKESILQSYKCLEKCTKKRQCQHDKLCDKFCYEECAPCVELIEEELSCKHKARFQCFNAKQQLKNYECKQPCNKRRPCGHLDRCLKVCGNHICTPCQQIVNKQFKCAHNVIEICSKLKGYQCKEICTKPQKCEHPCLKQCWEECGPCQQKISKVYASCAHVEEIACCEKESLKNNQCKQCAEKYQCHVQ